jgi:hypothetical protein
MPVNNITFDLSMVSTCMALIWVSQQHAEWKAAKKWLTEAGNWERSHLPKFKNALLRFEALGWNQKLEGYGTDCSSGSLSRVLSNNWLASSDLIHLAVLLQDELNDLGQNVKVVSPNWINMPQIGKDGDATGRSPFASAASREHLRRASSLLLSKKLHHLAGTANIDGCHWISFIVSGELAQILVGDSMLGGGEGALHRGERGKVIELLQWWIRQAQIQSKMPLTLFKVHLLVVQQQSDSFSCGVYTQNSITSFFNPAVHPRLLIASLRSHCVGFFEAIVEHHLDNVGVSCNLSVDSIVCR